MSLYYKKIARSHDCPAYPNCDCSGVCKQAIIYGHPFESDNPKPGEPGSNVCACTADIMCGACADAYEALKDASERDYTKFFTPDDKADQLVRVAEIENYFA